MNGLTASLTGDDLLRRGSAIEPQPPHTVTPYEYELTRNLRVDMAARQTGMLHPPFGDHELLRCGAVERCVPSLLRTKAMPEAVATFVATAMPSLSHRLASDAQRP